MQKLKLVAAVATVSMLAACGPGGQKKASGPAGPRNAVWVAGSSTVAPFASRVSENLARKTGGEAAKVETLGTGGGFKAFCAGTGSGHPDIATASRPMKASEFDACAAAGVTDITEIKIGYDGIVVITDKAGGAFDLTRADLYRALAAEAPTGSGFAPNPARTWRDVSASLPAQKITVYGPPPTSGTRDAFVELGMEGGAGDIEQLKALKASDEAQFKQKAGLVRTDGAWIDAGENDNVIIGTLTTTPGSLGVVGYSFLENNRDKVKAAKVGGVEPTVDTIASGEYPLSRSLFIYIKKANMALIPSLKDYVAEFVSDAASGRGGYLESRGLIALPEADRAAAKAAAAELPNLTRPAK